MMIITTVQGAKADLSEAGYDRFIRENGLNPEQRPDEEVAIDRLDLLRYNAPAGDETSASD